jgi:hypothetical protein
MHLRCAECLPPLWAEITTKLTRHAIHWMLNQDRDATDLLLCYHFVNDLLLYMYAPLSYVVRVVHSTYEYW